MTRIFTMPAPPETDLRSQVTLGPNGSMTLQFHNPDVLYGAQYADQVEANMEHVEVYDGIASSETMSVDVGVPETPQWREIRPGDVVRFHP